MSLETHARRTRPVLLRNPTASVSAVAPGVSQVLWLYVPRQAARRLEPRTRRRTPGPDSRYPVRARDRRVRGPTESGCWNRVPIDIDRRVSLRRGFEWAVEPVQPIAASPHRVFATNRAA